MSHKESFMILISKDGPRLARLVQLNLSLIQPFGASKHGPGSLSHRTRCMTPGQYVRSTDARDRVSAKRKQALQLVCRHSFGHIV